MHRVCGAIDTEFIRTTGRSISPVDGDLVTR